MTKDDLKKLVTLLKSAEQDMAKLEGGAAPVDEVMESVTEKIDEFHEKVSELGIGGLKKVGNRMAQFAARTNDDAEQLTTLAFALTTLRSGLQEGNSESIRSAIIETMEVLGAEPLEVSMPPKKDKGVKKPVNKALVERISTKKEAPPAPEPVAQPQPEPPPPPPPPVPPKVSPMLNSIGAKVIASPDTPEGSLRIELPAQTIEKISYLFSPFDPQDNISEELASKDDHVKNVLKDIKDFMASFAEGNLDRAQEVLQDLSGMQGGGELFDEIGRLARELHELLSGLTQMISTELQELVEDVFPDTGNRLEHIIQLTEEASNTTIDQAELIQNRIASDKERLTKLGDQLNLLKPIGTVASGRMDTIADLLEEMDGSLDANHGSLETIMTSQGYQDLTGQIVLKIIKFHKDLESRLISMVQSFGLRMASRTKKKELQEAAQGDKELYGPAHEKVTGAVKSQDEVDALLAQFGF